MKKAIVLAAMSAAAAFGGIKVKTGDTVAFLGDSITQLGQQKADGYVSLVLRSFALEGAYVRPIKSGVSGNRANNMCARLDRDVLRYKPQWMTLSCGVNDVWHKDEGRGLSLEEYQKNIAAIFDKCAASNCQVVVLTATMFEGPRLSRHNADLANYNDWLRAEAKRRGYPVADVNADMWKAHAENPSVKLTRDGVHMLPEGDRVMARGVLRAFGMEEERIASLDFESWKPAWVLCRFDLKSTADRNEYLKKSRALVDAVRNEPGCFEYRLLGDYDTDWDKPQRFGEKTLWMLEKWGSIGELKAHLSAPHMKEFGPALRGLRSGSTFHVLDDVLP